MAGQNKKRHGKVESTKRFPLFLAFYGPFNPAQPMSKGFACITIGNLTDGSDLSDPANK